MTIYQVDLNGNLFGVIIIANILDWESYNCYVHVCMYERGVIGDYIGSRIGIMQSTGQLLFGVIIIVYRSGICVISIDAHIYMYIATYLFVKE